MTVRLPPHDGLSYVRGMGRFAPGSLVKLKGDGRRMVVVAKLQIGDPGSEPWLATGWKEGDLLCSWRDNETKKLKTLPFEPGWLEPIPA